MILSVGHDVVHLPDFEQQLADPASVFVSHVFRPEERKKRQSRSLAARFAAKEAFIKAWSNAIFGQPPVLASIDFRDIEVVQDDWGRTAMRLHGPVREAFTSLGPCSIHVSLSHDGPIATATVTLAGAAR